MSGNSNHANLEKRLDSYKIQQHADKSTLLSMYPSSQSKTSLARIQSYIDQIKQHLNTFTEIPQVLNSFSEYLATQLQTLLNYYNSIISQLKNRCENLRITLVNYEEVKQLEKHRLIEELENKDQTIKDLLKRMQGIQRKHTQKAKEAVSFPDLAFEVKTLHTNNQKLIEVIEYYEKHIQQLESRKIWRSKEKRQSQQISNTQKRNNFLRDRYFQFKHQNEVLKSRITSLSKNQKRSLKMSSEDPYHRLLDSFVRTSPTSPEKDNKNYSMHKMSVDSNKNQYGSHRVQTQNYSSLKLQSSSKKTPKQKIKQLLDKYESNQKKKRSNSPVEKHQNNKLISTFLSTLRSA